MIQFTITIQDKSDLGQIAPLLLSLLEQYANANGLKIVGDRKPGEQPHYWFVKRGNKDGY